MTSLRSAAGVCALGLLLLTPPPAPAAWDNVFQVTCHGCRKNRVAAYAPVIAAAPPCCPTPCAPQVAYVQRSYYTPETRYEPVVNNVPVTSYRTSYFWEPVCSYTYSSYYDPCSGCPQSVATPTTSYRLRSQCNAVVNYVQRISYRPVTTYRQSCYMEAVPVAPACPPPCPDPAAAVAVAPPAAAPPLNLGSTPEPTLNENRSMPGATGTPGLGEDRRFFGDTMQHLNVRPLPPARTPAPPARPGQIAARPHSGATVQGQVVASNFAPRSGARVVFVNAQQQDVRLPATADASGRFRVALPAGGWYVYLTGADGTASYHSQLTVQPGEGRNVTVVSR